MSTKRYDRSHTDQRGQPSASKLARIAQLEREIEHLKELRKASKEGSTKAVIDYESDLRRFVDSNIVAIERADIFGNIYEVNDAMVELRGYSREEYASGAVRWHEITPSEYRHLDERAIEQIKATGRAAPWEKQYICKDGGRKTVLIGVLAADKTGKDCFSFALDISERKRVESEIKESEAKFRLLAEAMPQIVWIADSTASVIYHNQRYFDYTGLKPEQDHGFAYLEFVHPDDKALILSSFAKAQKTTSPFQLEYRYRSKTGQYRWHLLRGLPLSEPTTEAERWFGTCTDIDDRKQLELELRESEARFRTLANAIPQIVWTAKPDGTIDFFNDRWLEYTGLTAEQSKSDGWQLLIHPDDFDQYMQGWRQALATGDSYETEFRLKRAIGLVKRRAEPYRWHLARAVALRDSEGKIVNWFATWTEIEDQKRNNKANGKNGS